MPCAHHVRALGSSALWQCRVKAQGLCSQGLPHAALPSPRSSWKCLLGTNFPKKCGFLAEHCSGEGGFQRGCQNFGGVFLQLYKVIFRKAELAGSAAPVVFGGLLPQMSLPPWPHLRLFPCVPLAAQARVVPADQYCTSALGRDRHPGALLLLLALPVKGRLAALGIGHHSQEELVCGLFWQPEHLGHVGSQTW